jgi:tetratricopeptide (TPR) repeat protein
MGSRFPLHRLAIVIAAAALLCVPPGLSTAQEPPQPKLPDPQAPPTPPVEPPAKLPKPQRGDRVQNLDFLFGALKAAPDAETAKGVKELDLAVELLDAVVEIKPDYVEAWNRRATVHFLKKDYGRSLADIRQVLAREPRHFGALSGLGLIMQELGEEKRALEVFRRAIELHPHIERIPDLVKSLTEKVEGRDI